MKLLLDENITPRAEVILSGMGYDVVSVMSLDIRGKDDFFVFKTACDQNRVLITHNGKDFIVLVPPRMIGINHSGIVWLKVQLTRVRAGEICTHLDSFLKTRSELNDQVWIIKKDSAQSIVMIRMYL